MLRLCTPANLRLIQATQIDMQVAGSEANVAESLAHVPRRYENQNIIPLYIGYK